MAITDTKQTLKDIGPDLARRLLELNKWPNQRPMTPDYVAYLVKQMLAGKFSRNTVEVAKVMGESDGGRGFLMNGQQTLQAIIDSGVTLKQQPIITYWCQTHEDVAHLYATIDAGRTRNVRDALKAYGVHEAAGLELSALEKIAAAVKFIGRGFAATTERVDKPELAVLVKDWVGEYKALAETFQHLPSITGALNKRRMHRCDVLSVALATFKHQPAKARTFWSKVMDPSGLETYHPANGLNRWLISTMVQDGRMVIKPAYGARLVAACWNAHYENRELRVIKADPDSPMKLRGTPWKQGT